MAETIMPSFSEQNSLDTVFTDLGSKSSASGVTGNDAFSKINTLNSNIAGKVSGPGSATDGTIPLYDGTSGKAIKAGKSITDATTSTAIANNANIPTNRTVRNGIYNGLDKTSAGFALDARQGKALNDKIAPSGGKHVGFFVYNGKDNSGLFISYPRADKITATCSTFDLPGITTGLSVDSIEKLKNGFLLKHTFADTTTPISYNGMSGQATLSFS